MGDGAKRGGWRVSHTQGDQKEPRALPGDSSAIGGTWSTGGGSGGGGGGGLVRCKV